MITPIFVFVEVIIKVTHMRLRLRSLLKRGKHHKVRKHHRKHKKGQHGPLKLKLRHHPRVVKADSVFGGDSTFVKMKSALNGIIEWFSKVYPGLSPLQSVRYMRAPEEERNRVDREMILADNIPIYQALFPEDKGFRYLPRIKELTIQYPDVPLATLMDQIVAEEST